MNENRCRRTFQQLRTEYDTLRRKLAAYFQVPFFDWVGFYSISVKYIEKEYYNPFFTAFIPKNAASKTS